MEAVTLICAEPTILLISVQFGSWLVYFLNFHAPQCEAKASRGDPKKMTIAQRKAWWKHLSDICANLDPRFLLFVFCDATATMGSVVSQQVSSYGSAPSNVNSQFFASSLRSRNLFLPATFQQFHSGSNHTYTPSLTDRKRIDYVAIPSAIPVWNLKSSFFLSFYPSLKQTIGLHQFPLMSFCPSALLPCALTV